MKIKKIISYLFVFIFAIAEPLMAQQVRALYEKLTSVKKNHNYYTRLNLCREIIQICEEAPEPECWFSNIMRDVYRIKGTTEFEIYKKELKKERLISAINSLEVSYNLYRDPDVQFLRGYLSAVNSLLKKGSVDLTGLVMCWEAILDIYAGNDWQISSELIARTKQFIQVAEKFARTGMEKNYTGAFARYIIVLACDLMNNGNLSEAEKTVFQNIRNKYTSQESDQWLKWKNKSQSK